MAGFRLAFFLPLRPWHFQVSAGQVIALLLLTVALPLVHDLIDAWPQPRMNPYGVSYQASQYLFFFISVLLLLSIERQRLALEKLLVWFLSVVPTIWTICLLLDYVATRQTLLSAVSSEWLVFFVYIVWHLTVIGRALFRCLRPDPARLALLVCVYASINIPPLFYVPAVPLWYSTVMDASAQQKNQTLINVEDTFYLQHDLLALHGGSLNRHQPGETDLYFIGFAGFSDEDVFMNETLSVKRLMERQYTGLGNALVLINNIDTLSRYPLANRHNLEAALRMVAANIDVEEDIVFLFLTSHGTEDHRLSVQMPPLSLNPITPIQIQNAFLGADIKWKVIVVSACYSGGFIDYLQDPYTLIITAASPDRNSFGCGHDGAFTYFGEAYFQHALSQTHSFTEAFDLAAARILSREKQEGHLPSQPQIVAGNRIEEKLQQLYHSLDAFVSTPDETP